MLVLGLLLGIFGLHRYYAGKPVSATLLSLLSIGALLSFFAGYVGQMAELLSGYTAVLQSGNVAGLPDLTESLSLKGMNDWFLWAIALAVPSFLWLLADLFLVPSLVRKANAELMEMHRGYHGYEGASERGRVEGGGKERLQGGDGNIPDMSEFRPKKAPALPGKKR